jgi:protein tyrosine/serine phosphatase
MKLKALILISVIFFLFNTCGCAYLGYLKEPCVDIPNFHQVDDFLYRGGQPNEEGLIRLKRLEIKTIVSLRGENEELIVEKRIASQLGIDFINIPLSIYRRPTDEEAIEFLDIVIDKNRQPVFVHCESGRDRTGAFVALYRVVVQDWMIKQAYNEAKELGFWPYRGEAELHKFIHQLKDKKEYFKRVAEAKVD